MPGSSPTLRRSDRGRCARGGSPSAIAAADAHTSPPASRTSSARARSPTRCGGGSSPDPQRTPRLGRSATRSSARNQPAASAASRASASSANRQTSGLASSAWAAARRSGRTGSGTRARVGSASTKARNRSLPRSSSTNAWSAGGSIQPGGTRRSAWLILRGVARRQFVAARRASRPTRPSRRSLPQHELAGLGICLTGICLIRTCPTTPWPSARHRHPTPLLWVGNLPPTTHCQRTPLLRPQRLRARAVSVTFLRPEDDPNPSVEAGLRAFQPLGHEHLNRVGGARDQSVDVRLGLEAGKDVVRDRPMVTATRPADADPKPEEVLRTDRLRDRAQSVVSGEAASEPGLQPAPLEVDVVVGDEQRSRVDLEETCGRSDRAAGVVHVRLGLEERDSPLPQSRLGQAAGELRSERGSEPSGELVDDHPADVVPRQLVLATGIAQTSDEKIECRGVVAAPTEEAHYPSAVPGSPPEPASASPPVSGCASAAPSGASSPSGTSTPSGSSVTSASSGSTISVGIVTVARTVSSRSSR